jgi:PAS domain S-box-containing protein
MKSVAITANEIPSIHQEDSDTQTAILNVLTDYQAIARESVLSRRAVINVLEDLERTNATLKEKTEEMTTASEWLLHKNAVDTAILESIGDGIIVTDSNRMITFVNRAFETLTGWTAAEVIGHDITHYLPLESEHGSLNGQLSMIITEVLLGNTYSSDITKPFYNIRKDKTRFPASSTIIPVWLHGSVIGLVKTIRDITKEIDIDKAKTEFVSLASHQLRTPLSAINWYTEMLLSGDVGPITEGQEKYLNEAYRGNQRMISLVNALLNVTRMTLGTFVLEPEMVDLVTLIHSVLHEQLPESEKNNYT